MGNLAITYQHIADILSFESSNKQLEKILNHSSFNWDAIVIEGSKHLVLPAIYCRLNDKQLLYVLPDELKTYLEQITSINRNRNEAILNQAESISKLFNQNNIKHVFLKGTALLFLGCFKDNAERMIGDIDILVSPNQSNAAYTLLTQNDYVSKELTIKERFFEHRHLPRLISKHHIGAIELHKELFALDNYNGLRFKNMIANKSKPKTFNIPTQKQLLQHNILNYQINDEGMRYNSISFRSIYDTIALKNNNKDLKLIEETKVFRHYYKYASIFFNDLKTVHNSSSTFGAKFYLFKLKHIKFYKFWNWFIELIYSIPILINRAYLFIVNSTYRKVIFNDRIRVYKHLKSVFTKF
ncbi:nucleotidyltransferase family protein [Winogradskyella sp. R77965]|uniref:nucleotidyltransferase family protein n=1 Tax=Winogradskyella sp. R77965 TaxID=3093872 RepID=UPI0037DCC8E9